MSLGEVIVKTKNKGETMSGGATFEELIAFLRLKELPEEEIKKIIPPEHYVPAQKQNKGENIEQHIS
jgi:hypothetical protein